MRPVERGSAPGTYTQYGDAIDDLTSRMGSYCSYCERRLPTNLAVEHMCPKSTNPSKKLDWNNFLLACNNCNSVKGTKYISATHYLWPDQDNTMMAISYERTGFVRVTPGLSNSIEDKAKALIKLVGLDRHKTVGSQKPRKRDKRWSQREEIWAEALDALDDFKAITEKDHACRLVVKAAKGYGFFSVWMKVFEDYPDVRKMLIDEFSGTEKSCFDSKSSTINRPGGVI